MAEITVDASEVEALAAHLIRIPARAQSVLAPVVAKGAHNIKKQLQSEMGASGSFGHLAGGISYDLKDGGMTAEIGPHKARGRGKRPPRRGANIAYFGTYKGGGSVPTPDGALRAEVPAFEAEVLKAVGGLI